MDGLSYPTARLGGGSPNMWNESSALMREEVVKSPGPMQPEEDSEKSSWEHLRVDSLN